MCSRIAIMDHGRVIALGSPRELIAQHIEPQVVEVHGAGLEGWLPHAAALAPRSEHVGETLFCYAADPEPLLAQLRGRADLTYVHRPANLEDVFLKLTGRDLRD